MRAWRIYSKKTDIVYPPVFYSWKYSLSHFFFLFFLIWPNSFLVINHVDKVVGMKIIKWFIHLKPLDCDFFFFLNFTQLCTVSPGWGWRWKWVTVASTSVPVMFSCWIGWSELKHLKYCWQPEFNSVNQLLIDWLPALCIDQILWIQRGDKPYGCPSEEIITI